MTSSPAFSIPLTPMPNAPVPSAKDTKGAAKEFEGMFLSEMLSHMFDGLEVDDQFGGGHGEKMFRGMLVNQYGKMIANGKGIGLSDQIQKTMLEIQQKMNGG
jgi:flagellar protein FlgJ